MEFRGFWWVARTCEPKDYHMLHNGEVSLPSDTYASMREPGTCWQRTVHAVSAHQVVCGVCVLFAVFVVSRYVQLLSWQMVVVVVGVWVGLTILRGRIGTTSAVSSRGFKGDPTRELFVRLVSAVAVIERSALWRAGYLGTWRELYAAQQAAWRTVLGLRVLDPVFSDLSWVRSLEGDSDTVRVAQRSAGRNLELYTGEVAQLERAAALISEVDTEMQLARVRGRLLGSTEPAVGMVRSRPGMFRSACRSIRGTWRAISTGMALRARRTGTPSVG